MFAFFIFLIFDRSNSYKRIIFYSSIVLSIAVLFYLVLLDVEINENLISKYQSGTETSRGQILLNGLNLLRLHEFFTGAGLTSVLNSGPHNDYLRWTQRVGLIFMIISFLPFFIGLTRSWINVLSQKSKQILYIYFFITIFYCLSFTFWVSKRRCPPSLVLLSRYNHLFSHQKYKEKEYSSNDLLQ